MIINGDPSLTIATEHVFTGGMGSALGNSMSTTRITGGLRFDSAATPGRVSYDCTQVVTLQRDNGTLQPTVSSSGTVTIEHPLGTTTVRPCGP
jgi:hypothetical protein